MVIIAVGVIGGILLFARKANNNAINRKESAGPTVLSAVIAGLTVGGGIILASMYFEIPPNYLARAGIYDVVVLMATILVYIITKKPSNVNTN